MFNKLIYKKLFLSFLTLILFLSYNASAVNISERSTNCEKIIEYEDITTLVGSLLIMIFGFVIILGSIKGNQSPLMILFGISTTIFGFGSLLLGNYIFAITINLLC